MPTASRSRHLSTGLGSSRRPDFRPCQLQRKTPSPFGRCCRRSETHATRTVLLDLAFASQDPWRRDSCRPDPFIARGGTERRARPGGAGGRHVARTDGRRVRACVGSRSGCVARLLGQVRRPAGRRVPRAHLVSQPVFPQLRGPAGCQLSGVVCELEQRADRLDLARRLPHELQPPAAVLGDVLLEPCRQAPRLRRPRRFPAAGESGVGSRLLRPAGRLLPSLGLPGRDAPDAVSGADVGRGGLRDAVGGAKPVVALPLHDGHRLPARSGDRSDSRGRAVPERVYPSRADARLRMGR